MSKLAGSYPPNAPGLPRGRGRISADEVRAAQRERVVRAAVAVIAEAGYPATTVQEIVSRARVSRQAFYDLFESKEACCLAAIDIGQDLLFPQLVAAAEEASEEGWPATVHALVGKFLEVCIAEPEFTLAWALELPAAGPAGVRRRNEFLDLLASGLRRFHIDAATGAEPLAEDSYVMLIGGCNDLLYRYASEGRVADLLELEGPIAEHLCRVLL